MSSEDPTLEQHFRGHKDAVTAANISPNGKQIVSSSLDKTIMLWNYKDQRRAYRFVDF